MSATEVQQKRGHVALLLHLRCYNNTAICTGGHGSPAEPNRKPKDGGGFILWSMLGALTLGIVTVFYVEPYRQLTGAALYGKLKALNETPTAETSAQNA